MTCCFLYKSVMVVTTIVLMGLGVASVMVLSGDGELKDSTVVVASLFYSPFVLLSGKFGLLCKCSEVSILT